MSFAATLCPVGWGFDTIHVFTPALAARLKAAHYPGPLLALWRYVSLGEPFSRADITPGERDAILGAGWLLGLVQHVQRPSWQADAGLGAAHGCAAVAHAASVGYPAGCHIALDLEGVGNPGAPVMGYVVRWAEKAHAAGYRVLLYCGYDDGLTDTQVTALAQGGHVDEFWSDFGPRSLPIPYQFSVKQHAQTLVAGVSVDPDEIRLAGLALMGLVPDTIPAPPPEDAEPHHDETDPHT